VFRPEPLWHEIDVIPHWVYGSALMAVAGIAAAADYIRKRLKPPAEGTTEPNLEAYSIANQPSDAAIISAIVAPFGWLFIDHVLAPGLQRMMPAAMERAIYLLIFVGSVYISAHLSKKAPANSFSLEDLGPPSS
jgi:hypothetical protein